MNTDRQLKKMDYSNGMSEFRFWMTEANLRYPRQTKENRKRALNFILQDAPKPETWADFPKMDYKVYTAEHVEVVDIDNTHQYVIVWDMYDGATVYGRIKNQRRYTVDGNGFSARFNASSMTEATERAIALTSSWNELDGGEEAIPITITEEDTGEEKRVLIVS